MSHDVLILKDENGDIYAVSSELLKLAQIKTPEHIELIKKLTGNDALSGKPATKASAYALVGSFNLKDDKFLQSGANLGLTYSAPRVILQLEAAGYANPS